MTALLDQILPGPRHAIEAQLFELFVQLTHDRPPARQCLCAGCRSAPCRPGRLATSGHIELREPSCPSVPADVCQNGQMIQNKDCVLTDGLLFRNWTRVRFRVPHQHHVQGRSPTYGERPFSLENQHLTRVSRPRLFYVVRQQPDSNRGTNRGTNGPCGQIQGTCSPV